MNAPVHLPHDWFARPLPGNVRIGEHSWCYSSFAFIHNRCEKSDGITIGRHSGIYNGTFFDLGPEGEAVIGDYCTLVGAILAANCRVEIGNYCFLAHEVVLSDSFAPTPTSAETAPPHAAIVLEENCWVGMRASIIAPVRIGHDAIIGAASVVNFDVPPFAIVAGNPAKIVGWTNNKPG
jgi:acetyltransferase-like isoleucine patch superfamily enzyme